MEGVIRTAFLTLLFVGITMQCHCYIPPVSEKAALEECKKSMESGRNMIDEPNSFVRLYYGFVNAFQHATKMGSETGIGSKPADGEDDLCKGKKCGDVCGIASLVRYCKADGTCAVIPDECPKDIEVLDCSDAYSCQGQRRSCTSSCTINCGLYGCQGLFIDCPKGSTCNANCRESYSCQGATFKGDWTVNCTANYACQGII